MLYKIGDSKARKTAIWGYFKSFQSEMQAREIIHTSIVEKYNDTICFMVDIDQCLMEAVDPIIVWIMPMGYEVEEHILELYAQHF